MLVEIRDAKTEEFMQTLPAKVRRQLRKACDICFDSPGVLSENACADCEALKNLLNTAAQ